MVEANIFLAFIAGLAAFVSPCVLPLIPAFLAYMAGASAQEAAVDPQSRLRIIINTLFFVLGFCVVFSMVGILINGIASISPYSYALKLWISRIGGVFIIVMGLHLTGLLPIPLLEREFKVSAGKTRWQYLTSFVFGATFAAGWTPCVGPFLGFVLTLAFSNPVSAFPLLLAFSLGMTLPFLLTGVFYAQVSHLIKRAGSFFKYYKIVSGVILIALGVLVFTGQLERVASSRHLTDLIVWLRGG